MKFYWTRNINEPNIIMDTKRCVGCGNSLLLRTEVVKCIKCQDR